MPSPHDPRAVDVDVDDATDVADVADRPLIPEDLLAAVKGEGRRRRTRRHRRNTLVASLALAVAALPVLTSLPGREGSGDLRVAAGPDGSTTASTENEPRPSAAVTPASATTATTTPAALPTSAPATTPATTPTTGARPATPVPPTAPPPTAPPCRNSTSSSCGEFRWDPAPGANAPLEASFVEPPAIVIAGEATTFVVQWSDADAGLDFENFSPDGAALARSCATEPRFGPWDPPAPAGGSGTRSYTHTFAAPGTYTVTVSLGTDVTGGDCYDPYASDRIIDVTIEVVAPSP